MELAGIDPATSRMLSELQPRSRAHEISKVTDKSGLNGSRKAIGRRLPMAPFKRVCGARPRGSAPPELGYAHYGRRFRAKRDRGVILK